MTATATAPRAFEIKGTTGDVSTCDCCGRRGLRKTVVMLPLDADGNVDGEPTFYGTGCAAAALGWTSHRVRKTATAADARTAAARRATPVGRAEQAARELDGWHTRYAEHVASGTANEYTVKGAAFHTARAVGYYAPARKAEVEAQALAAHEAGGWTELLALMDHYRAEAQALTAA
jgi:hypothetical protein